jgi:hypothetical protein
MSPHVVNDAMVPFNPADPQPAPIPVQNDDGVHRIGDERSMYGVEAMGAFREYTDQEPAAIYAKDKQIDATVPPHHVLIPIRLARVTWRRHKR